MATGTIKKQVTETLSSLTPSSYVNTTGTDPTTHEVYRYGNVVWVCGYINFNSSASGTYRDYNIFTGAPPAASPYGACGAAFMDGTSMLGAMISVTGNGEIKIWVRGQAVASKKGPFFLAYIAKD